MNSDQHRATIPPPEPYRHEMNPLKGLPVRMGRSAESTGITYINGIIYVLDISTGAYKPIDPDSLQFCGVAHEPQ